MSQTNTSNVGTTKMLSWVYRSQMSQTTTNNYRTTPVLSRIYRPKMSQTTTYRKTQMLPRIYRS
jgi:hypothetical protein